MRARLTALIATADLLCAGHSARRWACDRPSPFGRGTHEGPNVTFWSKGREAGTSWLNANTGKTEEQTCKAR